MGIKALIKTRVVMTTAGKVAGSSWEGYFIFWWVQSIEMTFLLRLEGQDDPVSGEEGGISTVASPNP